MGRPTPQSSGALRLLAELVASSDDSIVAMALDGTIMAWNPGAERIYGYSALEAIGRSIGLIVPLDRAAELDGMLARIARGERVAHHETERVHKDGRRIPISVTISPVVDTQGRIVGASAIAHEVTQRLHTEQALRASEAQVRLLLDSTAEGIYGLDLHGICTLCNKAAARMLGYESADELIGKPIHELSHHSRADGTPYPETECAIHRAAAMGEGAHVVDELLWRADGSSFPVEYWAYPIQKHGVLVGAVVTFLDITERDRARLALEESEARYRTLVETSFDAIIFSADGLVREVNSGMERIFGWTPHEVIGRPLTDFVHDESLDEAARRVAGSIEGSYELVGRHQSGRKLILDVTARNFVKDRRAGRITAMRDITERRLLEQRVRQAQKMEALGALAGGVAHDFNNIITVITSYTEFVLVDLDAADPRAADLREVRKAADAAASLTRQLLGFSRQQLIQPRLVALETAVQRTMPLLRRVIGEDLAVVTALAREPTVVHIDPGQLEQVLMNLAINARDAMPTGGTLTVETAVVSFDEPYGEHHMPAAAGDYGMLAIVDTGVGMDEATRARIFEPFFTTKEVGRGTGLGLATVYGIVKQNAGFIWVYSEPGMGSTFKVYFPLCRDQEESEAPVVRRVPVGTETVLLVEDAPAVRAATRAVLERFGYTVLEVPDGRAALALLEDTDRHVDLLLTDVVLPEFSGRVLADRAARLRPGMKVLYVSGYTDDAVVRHGVLVREVAYVQKPFAPVALARKVREVLDGR
jgi:two-component system cell cycle sensor histidine kinase/response regulator CckA